MAEKKSITEAREYAAQQSRLYPGLTFWVMDKLRKHAVVVGQDWIYRERVLEGWRCICKYRDGKTA